MTYLKEKIFVEKLCAALQLNGCEKLDISEENINRIIPIIYQVLYERKMVDNFNELEFLLGASNEYKFTNIYKVINDLDPLFAEREDNTLLIIADKSLSKEIIKSDFMFEEEDIMYISNIAKPVIGKKNKVKEFKINAFD